MKNLKIYNKKQKTAIITGASEGIGAAFSKLLIKKGWKVFGISRSSSKLMAMSKSFQSNKQEEHRGHFTDVASIYANLLEQTKVFT